LHPEHASSRKVKSPDNIAHQVLFEFLEAKWQKYENEAFIGEDPIAIPRSLQKKEDIEISAFLTATIAWGNRKSIMTNARRMLDIMDGEPHAFLLNAGAAELSRAEHFVHRTFNGTDFLYFVASLANIYRNHGGLEGVFSSAFRQDGGAGAAIHRFREVFFELDHPARTLKHVADPLKGSSAKRLNMFLRWMVRSAQRGVDFGMWTSISPSQLAIPLDVHTGNVARSLGLMERPTNDWRAVEALMEALRAFDANDPVKYDFALFGTGVYGDVLPF